MAIALLRLIAVIAVLCAVAPNAHAQLSTAKLESWLSGYREAWEKRDAQRAAQLFTENARYQEMPFDAPKSGRGRILPWECVGTAEDERGKSERQQRAAEGGRHERRENDGPQTPGGAALGLFLSAGS